MHGVLVSLSPGLLILVALNTTPYVPSPIFPTILYCSSRDDVPDIRARLMSVWFVRNNDLAMQDNTVVVQDITILMECTTIITIVLPQWLFSHTELRLSFFCHNTLTMDYFAKAYAPQAVYKMLYAEGEDGGARALTTSANAM